MKSSLIKAAIFAALTAALAGCSNPASDPANQPPLTKNPGAGGPGVPPASSSSSANPNGLKKVGP